MTLETNKMESCIEDCDACHASCVETATHCLKMGGEHATQEHIRLLWDCSEMCALAADFMRRGSDFFAGACDLCADICERCAEACAKFGDDPIMRTCVRACRKCTESCRVVASLAA